MGLIYLDSCIVIDLLEGDDSRSGQLARALAEVDQAAVSPLVHLECSAAPMRAGDEFVLARYEKFLAGCVLVGIDVAVCRRAARLRSSNALRTPDAIHLAAAMAAGCDGLWTSDARLAGAADGFAVLR